MMTEIIVTADILRSFVIPEETGQGSKNLLIGDIRMRFLWKLIKWLVGLALILFLAAGLYAEM